VEIGTVETGRRVRGVPAMFCYILLSSADGAGGI